MGKRSLGTPRSKVRAVLHQLFLRSRERASAIKRDSYTCRNCKVKQSKAKGKEISVEIHHVNPVEWEKLIDHVYETLLCDPKYLATLCHDCHKFEHWADRMEKNG